MYMGEVTNQHSDKINLKPHNVEIYFEKYINTEVKNAPVILLLHGFLSSSFSFRKLIPYLQKSFTVYTIDLPGFGESEKSTKFQYSLQSYGQLVIDFIHEMQLGKVNIIGHSMGGQIGLHAIKIAPHKISKIIVLGCSAYIKRTGGLLRSCCYVPFFSLGLRYWVQRKDIRNNLLEVVYDSKLIDDEMINGYRKQLMDKKFYLSLIRLVRSREGDLTSEELLRIKHPCLLIWGKEDKVIPVGLGHRLHSDLPNSTLKIYEKAGHLLPEEIPDKLYKDICEFLL
jgi:pimeloyl-ACP methyl ester carboxylesterase